MFIHVDEKLFGHSVVNFH